MTKKLLEKCAEQVAETMMAHYWNHNVVTDSWECGAEDQGFSEEEIEAASDIDLEDPEFKNLVIAAVTKEIKNA